MKILIELDYFCSILHTKAESIDYYRKRVMLIVLACLSTSLYFSKEILYWLSAIALLFHIGSLFMDWTIKKTRALASEIQKISMLSKTFGQDNIDFHEVTRLKVEAGTGVNAKVQTRIDNNEPDESTTYTNDETEHNQKLLRMIQENAFWNGHLYYFAYKDAKRKIIFMVAVISILALVLIPNVKLDQDYTLIRLVFTVLSFGVVYEFVETMFKFQTSSKQMTELDHKISRLNTIEEQELLNIFSSYHNVISTTSPIPSNVYASNKNMLNATWRERI